MKLRRSFRAARALALLAAGFIFTASVRAADSSSVSSTPAAQIFSANYTLAAADILEIKIAGDPKASCIGRITSNGNFTLPYLDEPVKLSGFTVSEAVKAIAKLYVDRQVFVNPQVSLTVSHSADRHINVIGKVMFPGIIAIPPWQSMSLVSVLYSCGGFTRITITTATITRQLPDGKTQTIKVDILLAMEDPRQDVMLQDGDTVLVQ